jgi:hypothetical protein
VRSCLRSATTEAGLASATWYGPASTTDWYTVIGTAVNGVHGSHRWIQYQAVLSSPTFRAAPSLDSVTIRTE